MSDTREKLIEILISHPDIGMTDTVAEMIADYLIDNGVTVQEWIPAVTPPKESGEYIVMIHKAANPPTLLYSAEEKSWYEVTKIEITNLYGEEVYTYYPVDWWMPLPEPPKEG